MNTIIGLFLIAGIALFIAFIGYLICKLRAWNDGPEIETEHDWDAAQDLDDKRY